MNHKAKRLGTKGRMTAEGLALILIDYPKCPYCGVDLDVMHCSFDHVLAFDRGGSNTRDNIVACCLTCQRAKYTKSPEQFASYVSLTIVCPVDGTVFRPRYADWIRGL